jgi:2'-5' RNA ligase
MYRFPIQMEGFKTARLFFALPVSEEIREKCIAIQDDGRKQAPSVRWGDPAQLHVTLVFLGELEPPQDIQVKEVVQDIANNIPPFSVEVSGLGVFPERQSPKVIWIGVSASPLLMSIQQRLANGVAAFGIPLETRPYRPHLTLGRIRKGAETDCLAPWMKQEEEVKLGRCEIKEVMLMESELRPEGSLYKCLVAAPLRG